MKTIVAILLCVGTAGICLGQGTVFWGALNPGAISAQTNATQFYGGGSTGGGGAVGNTAPASSGTMFYFELLYNTNFTGSQVPVPDYLTLFGGTWLDTGLTATNGNIAGWLTAVNPTSAAVVPWANGVTNNILLVGWSANLGTDWLTVSNEMATQNWPYFSTEAFFGESATGFMSPGTLNPGVSVFANGSVSYGLPIYSLNMQLYSLPLTIVTPEPSTIVLAGLGGLSLLFFCRQRR